MELTPKLNEQVMDAIAEAIKGLKPRPAVDRVITARLTGKWTHYVQVLLTYTPDTYGLAYCNIDKRSDIKVKIHDGESKAGKFISGKELRRLKGIEKREAAKLLREEKAKAKGAGPSKAEPKTVKVKATTKKMPVVKFDKDLPTLEGRSMRQVKK
jgi:hypothetical protein